MKPFFTRNKNKKKPLSSSPPKNYSPVNNIYFQKQQNAALKAAEQHGFESGIIKVQKNKRKTRKTRK